MPKKIDPKVKERCVQQMLDHVAEFPSPTAAAEVVAKRKKHRTVKHVRRFLNYDGDSVWSLNRCDVDDSTSDS